MTRFDYLNVKKSKEGGGSRKKARKAEKRARKAALTVGTTLVGAVPTVPSAPPKTEPVSSVYVRKETVRAVWRVLKHDGHESVSELVEDLLLAWLREQTR